ncbi:MAG: aldehyde ferredoxin oxidoreductase family protein [Spirochaetes bacterium]|nr:aldehyde ferredoxin oxidoreductase family protein [Spirochaetota bacterium]
MNGYFGKILHINLTLHKVRIEEFNANYASKFIGGNGFAVDIISQTIHLIESPFSENNVIVFACGPFTGSPVWGCGRAHAATISPLTGLFGDSNFGGNFASMLKSTGYDAVVISGKSPTPLYVFINENEVTFHKANSLWGLDTSKTIATLKSEFGNVCECAVIGPAGEHLVPFASIIVSGARVSAAGRMGLGAVMGSKNLKAIVVMGNKKLQIAFPDKLSNFLKNRFSILRDNTKELTELGTPVLVKIINDRGMLASRNNQREVFEKWEAISGERIAREFKVKNIACRLCPIACGKLVKVKTGKYKGQSVKMPEFESIYALATMCDDPDIDFLFEANTLCDDLGLDTISTGVTLSFAAECLEKELCDEKIFGTKKLFGNSAALLQLINDIAYRRGAGEILSLGSEKMAEVIGKNAHEFLYSVKGLEIAGHSARGIRTMGLAYATSTRGGSHHDARPRYPLPDFEISAEEIAKYCVESQNYTALGDSLVMCRFIMERGFGRHINEAIAEAFYLVTGFDFSPTTLSDAGARIYTFERHINCLRGVSRINDTLPFRVMNEPIPNGPAKGRYVSKDMLNQQLDFYYKIRGWSENGIPTIETLRKLDLEGINDGNK